MRKLVLLLSMCMLICTSWAQNRTVTGKVTDGSGNPVPGASVLVKGTKTGTSANNEGNFSISVPQGAKALVVSNVNFVTLEVPITGKSNVAVTLTSSVDNLGEVVVVAYGTVKKEALTGSVGTIKSSQIAQRPVGNVTNAIEGAIAGVVTGSPSGQPGSGLAVRVRGFGSFSASSEPLYVVDGAPYVGGTSNINPDDVESITVLKDAASTALYGSRAANGIVMITTKKGIKGRNNVGLKVTQGVVTRGLKEYDKVDAKQYYPLMWEAYRNSLVYPASGTGISLDSANRVATGLSSRTSILGLLAYNPFNVAGNAIVGVDGQINPQAQLLYGDDLDWTKDLMRDGTRKDYNLNFNGGSDKSDYFVSLGYVKEQGYTVKTDLERYSARLNMNVSPKPWLKAGLNISGNYSLSNTANDGGSTNFVNPFFFSRNVGPIYPVYAHNMTTGDYLLDGTGSRFYDLGNMGGTSGVPNRPSGGFAGRHGVAETNLNETLFRRTVASARTYQEVSFLKYFKATNTVAVDQQTQNDVSYENTLVGDGAPAGRSRRTTTSITGLVLTQLLGFNKSFGRDHRVDAVAGHETYNNRETGLDAFKQGQSLQGNTELGNFTTINSATSYVDKYHIESYFSRVNYDYQGKYLFTGSVRADGNSRFSPESRWGTFYSVGLGWKIDKESFMANVSWVDALKLRGSFGEIGNSEGIGLYAYQGLYGFSNNANEPGIVQSQTAVENRLLTWEKNRQLDIGLDFSLFKGRINGSVEYYRRGSSALLFAVPTALSTGFLSATKNTATMNNTGIELQLGGDIIRTKDVTWNMNVNLSTVKNEITQMPEGVTEFVSGTKKYSVGQSIFGYWLRSYYGVDPSDGSALYVADNTTSVTGRRILTNKSGGTDTLTTLASNGKFAYHETSIPDLYGSFTESVSYKGFTLSALFTFQLGGKTFDANYQGLMSSGTYGGALSSEILGRWQKVGDITDIPRMDAGRTTDFNATSSRWLIDASYLNIRTISLSYALPRTFLTRLKVTNSSVFVSAENLAFFSKRTGLNNQQAFSGVTSNAYPPARVISAGISLNF